jgi:4-amino-4-deoxy-L-arabinose transferase-like glycosyltransferase
LNNADIIVMALLLACTVVIVRVRRRVASLKDFIILGLLLGTGFLAKTAFSVVIPMFLVTLGLILRSWLDRRIAVTAFMAFAIAAPFVAAISITHGRFTMGDSGRLNYSWQVTGISVEGYKENAYWPGSEIHHPIHVLLKDPRVLSFEQHLIGTLPVHSDVSWWCEGYPVRFDSARQLMILWSNVKFSISAFRCPAVFLILLCLPFGATGIVRRFARTWFLWAPALLFAFTYCFVFSDWRYLAGSYALIGFALIAAAWQVKLPSRLSRIAMWTLPILTVALTMGSGFRRLPPQLIGDLSGSRVPWGYSTVQVAETMQRFGLRPGDRVAYIGFSLGAAHVGLEQAHVVAMIPERVTHDDTVWGRPLVFTFPKPHDFWRRSPEDQKRVFAAFRSVGAKWVFADTVPKGTDTRGWQVAGKLDEESYEFRPGDQPYVYFRKLLN